MTDAPTTKQLRAVTALAALVVLAALVEIIVGIRTPQFGGDELLFAFPLAYEPVTRLKPFEFGYAGPLKAIVADPVFRLFGFGVVTTRAISIASYLATAFVWCRYLVRSKLPWAAAIAAIAFALHGDLFFFAKDDINQPTFHDLFAVLQLVVFLDLLRDRSSSWRRGVLFVVVSLLAIDNHIRHIWFVNGLVAVWVIDRGFRAVFARAWPIVVAWIGSVACFVYVLVHFAGDRRLEGARALGDGVTWGARARFVAAVVAESTIGGRILADVYGRPLRVAVFVVGSLFTIASVVVIVVAVRRARRELDWPSRLAVALAVLFVAVVAQWAVTRSAVWAWHANYAYLVGVLLFSVVADLVVHRDARLAAAWAGSLLGIMAIVHVALAVRVRALAVHPEESGWRLAIWNPQCVAAVSAYVAAHPGRYAIADWEIGRVIDLAVAYAHPPGTSASPFYGPLTPDAISSLEGAEVVRSTALTRTVPDLGDAELARVDARFEVQQVFYDPLGRPAYELGVVRRTAAAPP